MFTENEGMKVIKVLKPVGGSWAWEQQTETQPCVAFPILGPKGVVAYTYTLSLSPFHVTPSSASFMEVCLCSRNSDGEQTPSRSRNLRSWQKWWHRTCLPARKLPHKSASPLRWYSKWAVYILRVLITNSRSAQQEHPLSQSIISSESALNQHISLSPLDICRSYIDRLLLMGVFVQQRLN